MLESGLGVVGAGDDTFWDIALAGSSLCCIAMPVDPADVVVRKGRHTLTDGSSSASERDLSECSKLWLVCSLHLPAPWLCCLDLASSLLVPEVALARGRG